MNRGIIVGEIARQIVEGKRPTTALLGRQERASLEALYGQSNRDPTPELTAEEVPELTAEEVLELRRTGTLTTDGQHWVAIYFVPYESHFEVF